jgi:hypothetical protein
MDMDSVRSVLDGMSQGQSVMLATNEIMATCALAFCVASALIWLAPPGGSWTCRRWANERPEGGCRWRNTH